MGLSAPAVAAWVTALKDAAEYTLTGVSAFATLKSYSVAIPADSWARIRFSTRFDNAAGGAANAFYRLHINSVQVGDGSGILGNANTGEVSGVTHQIILPPRSSGYQLGGLVNHAGVRPSFASPVSGLRVASSAAVLPTAAITTFEIQANSSDTGDTLAIKNMLIETRAM